MGHIVNVLGLKDFFINKKKQNPKIDLCSFTNKKKDYSKL